jgi:hypothetical protein
MICHCTQLGLLVKVGFLIPASEQNYERVWVPSFDTGVI